MGMPEATKVQLEDEVLHTLQAWGIDFGALSMTAEIMSTVVKAWYFGRDTGYREVRDTIANGEYFN